MRYCSAFKDLYSVNLEGFEQTINHYRSEGYDDFCLDDKYSDIRDITPDMYIERLKQIIIIHKVVHMTFKIENVIHCFILTYIDNEIYI